MEISITINSINKKFAYIRKLERFVFSFFNILKHFAIRKKKTTHTHTPYGYPFRHSSSLKYLPTKKFHIRKNIQNHHLTKKKKRFSLEIELYYIHCCKLSILR